MPDLMPTDADPLTELLEGVRSTGAVLDESALADGRERRFANGTALALVVPLGGRIRVRLEGGEPVEVNADNVVLMAGGAPYIVESGSVPVRAKRAASASVRLMTCWYDTISGMHTRVLGALPALAVIETTESCPISPSGFAEIGRAEPGERAFLDRMMDLLLISALRAWFTRPGAEVPAWYAAHRDPVAGAALRLLEGDLAYRWTIEELARRVGVSRAALARRFTGLVGEPPMGYLRRRRLDRAGELLKASDSTIGAIATQVGFSTPFALSAAFKRERGVRPSQYREG
jgi:AraC-like DNA-binding protein